jgi:hypothetical protein
VDVANYLIDSMDAVTSQDGGGTRIAGSSTFVQSRWKGYSARLSDNCSTQPSSVPYFG